VERSELLGCEILAGHLRAGLELLRIENPRRARTHTVLERACADRHAACHMREVGRVARLGGRAVDRMAHRTTLRDEEVAAARLLVIDRRYRGLALLRGPSLVDIGGVFNDVEGHMRMLIAA